jgi:SPP1 gp7 family putative phage head morphogenesis protein
MIAEKLNKLIEELIILNFGEQKFYPKLTHSRIRDKAGREFAEIIKMGKDAGIIIPDDSLETFYRSMFDLPGKDAGYSREEIAADAAAKAEEAFNRQVEIAKNTAPDKEEKEEKKNLSEIKLSDKPVTKQIKRASKDIIKVYEDELQPIVNDLIGQVIKNFESATTDLQKIGAARGIQARNVSKYRKALYGFLKNVSDESVDDVMSLFKKQSKLTELAEKGSKGKKKVERFIIAQTDAVVETQINDVKNAIAMQFTSSVNEDSAKRIQQDLEDRTAKKMTAIKNGAATVVSSAVNKSREFLFFDDELIEEVESYTFMNDDPKTDICIALNGKVFATNDADSIRYAPPIHINCMSYLSPNFRGVKGNPDITGLTPYVTEENEKNVTLSEMF